MLNTQQVLSLELLLPPRQNALQYLHFIVENTSANISLAVVWPPIGAPLVDAVCPGAHAGCGVLQLPEQGTGE